MAAKFNKRAFLAILWIAFDLDFDFPGFPLVMGRKPGSVQRLVACGEQPIALG